MFSPDAPRPSLVETATTTGHPTRSRLFAASVTGVSDRPAASRASVVPVQGAMTSASAKRFGPSGSTACRLSSTGCPVSCSSRSFHSDARPKRVSSRDAAKLMTGSSSQPCCTSCSACAAAAPSVQKLPQTANAALPRCCVFMHSPPVPAGSHRPSAPQIRPPSPVRRPQAGSAHGAPSAPAAGRPQNRCRRGGTPGPR